MKNKVIVYGTENCFTCKQMRHELTKKKISFEYVDVSTLTTDQLNKITEEHGMSLPIKVEVKE